VDDEADQDNEEDGAESSTEGNEYGDAI